MDSNQPVEFVPAGSIVFASRRFDFGVKMALVKAWLSGDKTAEEAATVAYLETIRAAGNFHEIVPKKDTPQEFLRSFRATFESMRKNGFVAERPIRVGSTGEALNNAHRLAIAAVLGLDVPVIRLAEPVGGKMDANRLRKHCLHPSVERFDIRAYVAANPYAAVFPRNAAAGEDAVAVWYSSRRGKIVRMGKPQPHDETMRALDALFPPLPFPDWKMRWLLHMPNAVLWRLDAARHRFRAIFSRPRRRRRHIFHMGELLRRWRGMKLLADFTAQMNSSK